VIQNRVELVGATIMWEGTTAPAHLVRSGTQTGEEKVNKSEIFETLFDAIFSLSRNICEDVDECSNASMCVGGKCTNYVRTYACECKKGYQFDKNTKTCIGECASPGSVESLTSIAI